MNAFVVLGLCVVGFACLSDAIPLKMDRTLEKTDVDIQFDQDPYLRYYGNRQFSDSYDQQAMQKRRFAMGMPNLVHVGIMQKRQVEQMNMNKRRIGLSMPSVLFVRGVNKRPLLEDSDS
ncbi:hypothetical protein M3Y97_00197300 [Aphelenchoides bicaudatus]|nr:hypothetical protein M3Y97_00197300 [Aphelenchoides bicaudatus]